MTKSFQTFDGNEACAYAAYAFTEVAAIYPITPSSPMAGKTDAWSAKGRKNLFGQTVSLIEMQAESGAIGAIHGSLEAGALSTTFTSSQGLMLMIPVLHRIAGERLPAVVHVAARTVGTHALSIMGDHSDVMCCRNTGFALLSSSNAQEVMDLAPIAHLAAIQSRVPFMHFFDGFRTSHELSKVEPIEYDALRPLIDYDALKKFKLNALNPDHPKLHATVQNGDVYFQVREANNPFYDAVPEIVQNYMDRMAAITGRSYRLFDYYGAADADRVVVAMGSVGGAIREIVDYLNRPTSEGGAGEKVGFVQVHLFRPFSSKHLLAALPPTARRIAVLDRCKEMGAVGEPLYLDVCAALFGAHADQKRSSVEVVGGRYGLSSKDVDPAQIKAVFDNLKADRPKSNFSIGIVDDVTHLSLPIPQPLYPDDEKTVCCKFWGLGSDGTVGANKNTVEIINAHTTKFAQAYFEYDAKKSYGVTKSHLRFANAPIRGSYYVKAANFIGCHNETYVFKYDIAEELKDGGTLLLNCSWEPETLGEKLPAKVKRELARKQAKLYIIDAVSIAQKLGLGSHINTILQAAFFHLANVIPEDEAIGYMKAAAAKSYLAKGEEVVKRNCAAIDEGAQNVVRINIPDDWANAQDAPELQRDLPPVVKNILFPINAQKGDDLPVSAFKGYEDGVIEMGLTAYEKRAIAVAVPAWNSDKCLQCNRCAFVCPHAVIRPFLLTEEEAKRAPEGFNSVPAKGLTDKSLRYSLQISEADCTGCGVCVQNCPAKEKAITMKPFQPESVELTNWNFALSLSDKGDVMNRYSIKGSQFRQPLVEFSAACAGCGETPYAKLLTQLFGDRCYWANATGCSQAWGSPMPGIPYTTNKKGHGPAWTNSLFENNAEFALGMLLSSKKQRDLQRIRANQLLVELDERQSNLKSALENWLDAFDDFDRSEPASETLVKELELIRDPNVSSAVQSLIDEILSYKDQLSKKTFWMFGGDGWAYDIGFGGLDHVLSTGENINVFVIDTEVYSNTGGQSSKATPLGAVAEFASSGKKSPKKQLGKIFMAYGNVYVAQVAMGADPNQLIKAVQEAQAYNGPSIVIAYTPCQAHGLKCGMCNVQNEMKRAVETGYWTLYRYNPTQESPFTLDSKEPTLPYTDFLDGETRFLSLKRQFPDNARQLFARAEEQAKENYQELKNGKK